MPSSTNPSQPAPIVQTIFDSVTRCFNPIDGDESPFSSRCGYPSSRSCPTSSRHRHAAQESTNTTNTTARSATNNNQQTSRRTSSASQDAATKAYDADRYLERKLEIFRTTDDDCLAEFGIQRPRPSKRQKNGTSKHRRGDSSNTLVYASESDEITNLTEAQRRADVQNQNNNTPRGGNDKNQNNPVVASFVKLLRNPFNCINEVQKQPIVGMCFATPVRTSSREDISNLSDWKLTAEEFASRHVAQQQRQGQDTAVPDVDESSASHSDQEEEEETITSASYFDQKYPVTSDANPPMPLFKEHRVPVSEYETNEILKIVEQRGEEKNSNNKRSISSATGTTTSPRSSPTNHVIVKKNMRSASKSKLRRSSAAAAAATAAASSQQYKRKGKYYDSSVVPLGKSSSVSTEDADHANRPRGVGEQHQSVSTPVTAEI